ncbi:hypothetical protein CEXT_199391 [Caerostris extrusa]|uniref:Uncharacterized protein n=1 Tax=Caerostris extrusa TaxID=172846 RepID=A0AAV4WRE9_CAEEX|nr:hypothetical protein CEXT_199391 [Caerostris extrusa]
MKIPIVFSKSEPVLRKPFVESKDPFEITPAISKRDRRRRGVGVGWTTPDESNLVECPSSCVRTKNGECLIVTIPGRPQKSNAGIPDMYAP